MAFVDRLPNEDQAKSDSNPYNPEVPSAIQQTDPVLHDYLTTLNDTIRTQHNRLQAGDTTFPWQVLTAIDATSQYTLGSSGRFSHPEFGLIRGIYVQFDSIAAASDNSGVAAFVRLGAWAASNQLGKSNDKIPRGMLCSYRLPKQDEYGWLVTVGINLQSMKITGKKPSNGDLITWESDGTLRVDGKSARTIGRVTNASNMMTDGDSWWVGAGGTRLELGDGGFLVSRALQAGQTALTAELDFGNQIAELKQRLELNEKGATLSLETLSRRVTVLTKDRSSVEYTERLSAMANFAKLGEIAANNAGFAASLTHVNLIAINEFTRSAGVYRDEAGFYAYSASQMANTASLSANDGAVSAAASAKSSQEASVKADAAGVSAQAAESSALRAEAAANNGGSGGDGGAGASAAAALEYRNQAQAFANQAGGYSSTSQQAAANSQASAGQASASANQADSRATNAQASANQANQSADTARGYRDTSQTNATNANTSATVAQNAATQASNQAASASQSASLAASYTSASSSPNIVTNTNFTDSTNWQFVPGGGGFEYGVDLAGSYWQPNGEHALVIHQLNADNINANWVMNAVAAQTSTLYEMSVWLGRHRCNAEAILYFLDVNGQILAGYNAGGPNRDLADGNLSSYDRVVVRAQSPSNASYCRIQIIKYGTKNENNNSDSWMWVIRPQIKAVTSQTAQPTPYSPYSGSGGTADLTQVNARIDQEASVRASADGALGQRIDRVIADFSSGGNASAVNARLTDEINARADADTAQANRISNVEASYNGVDARITTVTNAVSDVQGRTQAYFSVVAQTPGQRTQLTISAGGSNPGFDLIGNVRIAGDLIVSGTVTIGKLDRSTMTASTSGSLSGTFGGAGMPDYVVVPNIGGDMYIRDGGSIFMTVNMSSNSGVTDLSGATYSAIELRNAANDSILATIKLPFGTAIANYTMRALNIWGEFTLRWRIVLRRGGESNTYVLIQNPAASVYWTAL